MFNLQGSEIIFILLLALVVLGPEKLPGAIRRFTRTYAELRKMGTSFQDEVKSAFEEPAREVRETADLIRHQVDVEAMEAEHEAAEQSAGDDGAGSDGEAPDSVDGEPDTDGSPGAEGDEGDSECESGPDRSVVARSTVPAPAPFSPSHPPADTAATDGATNGDGAADDGDSEERDEEATSS